MMRWMILAGIYGWIGFTTGYFFRKWLERSWRPRYQQNSAQHSSADEPVDWVDENDHVQEVRRRHEIRQGNLLHRVTATFVFHPDGRIFLQQRTSTKDVYPGLFDPCVGGTVTSGETYAENACREPAEELGAVNAPVYELFGHRFEDESTNSLIRVFACIYDGPIRLQESEVAGGAWADETEVERLIAARRVCPDSAAGWRLYLARFGTGRNFARDIAPELRQVGVTGR
jgi:isopentenyldiphosphate isomerase